MSGRSSVIVERSELPAGVRALPVRTGLVRPGDDVLALLAAALRGIAAPGDVVGISETALAIAQGEFVAAEHIRPSKLAFVLCRLAGPMATISQPESLQLVIERVGAWRVAAAALLGILGRIVGRRGVFYELLGEAIAAVDGYTGTMPPYERAIVLSPRDPDAFAEEFRERTGMACAVVDANDLGVAKILGCSNDVRRGAVECALLGNPAGNSDEQTPIVVLKWRGNGENPLLQ